VIERPCRPQVDGAADTALGRASLGRLEHVGARNHVRGENVEREVAAVIVGRQDTVVERRDIILRAEAADADILALATRRAVDRDAGDMLQRVRHVAVGETAQFSRVDRIEHDGGAPLDLDRLVEAAADAGDDDIIRRFIGCGRIRQRVRRRLGLSLRRRLRLGLGHCRHGNRRQRHREHADIGT